VNVYRQIGRELGVKYLLEGSIRQENNRVRITAQLVDGSTGNHVFSEKYDRDLKEIFATQDEITLKILKAFQLNLTEGDQALVYARGTDNLEAYLKLLQATEYVRRQNPNDNEKAKRILEDAIAIDPNYPMPYRMLGALYMMEAWLGSATSPRDSLQKGAELLQRTIVLDPTMGSAYAVLGNINILLRDFERGIELGQKAVELEPNGADSHAYLGLGFLLVGRLEDALKTFKNAIRLNPDAPAWYLHNLAAAYSYSGFYDEAIEWAKKAINRHPNNIFAHMVLAANYIQVGRDVEARAEAEQVLRINPSFSLERFAKINPFKSQEMHKRYIDALSKAGLK
jgi:adenylate cyclase